MTFLAQDFFGIGAFGNQTSGGPLNPTVPNQASVQDLGDLTALAVPAGKSVCYVEDELAEYYYDADSTAAVNGITVLNPDSINPIDPGRWILQRADLSSVTGGLIIQGSWNATTNSPNLTASAPANGFAYVVNVAGVTNLGGITDWEIGDLAVSRGGGVWVKVDNTDKVFSVNSQVGAVVLDTDDVAEGVSNLYFTTMRARTAAVADAINNGTLDIAPSQNAVFDALALKADRWESVEAAVSTTAAYGDLVAVTVASVVVSLPAGPTAADDGKSIIVKRRHAGVASSVSGNGELIDGSASVSLTTNGTALQFIWNETSGEWNQV